MESLFGRCLLQSLSAAVGLLFLSLTYGPAISQTRVKLGYTATSEFLGAYVAAEEGYFKSRGLDVELILIPLNSNIPAALQSGSLQLGGPTTTMFLQAVDGGLKLVVIAGGSIVSKSSTNFSVVGRNSSNIRKATDFVGKRVGVAGIGAIMQVMFRKWLTINGVDPKQITWVEAPIRGAEGDMTSTGEVCDLDHYVAI